jgi:2-hydroxycyclohexanecarboxyl-CoA dehydrogenase
VRDATLLPRLLPHRPGTMSGPGAPRVAVVTGGASGIGRGVCRVLAAQGRTVVVADVNLAGAEHTAAALRDEGAAALACDLDVTDAVRVRDAMAAVASDLGPVSILVNAAGWDDFVAFVDTDEDFWYRILEINYLGVLRTCHAVVPQMTELGWGRVVNIGSDAARVGSSLESVYAGAKGAVVAFTKSLAREVARHGVTANVVCPGPTDTPMIRGMAERMGAEAGATFVRSLERAIPLRRLAEPDEIATAVGWFTAEDAGYITGQTLSVSGGLTMI